MALLNCFVGATGMPPVSIHDKSHMFWYRTSCKNGEDDVVGLADYFAVEPAESSIEHTFQF